MLSVSYKMLTVVSLNSFAFMDSCDRSNLLRGTKNFQTMTHTKKSALYYMVIYSKINVL